MNMNKNCIDADYGFPPLPFDPRDPFPHWIIPPLRPTVDF